MLFTSTLGIESNHHLLKFTRSGTCMAGIPAKGNSLSPRSQGSPNVRQSRNSVFGSGRPSRKGHLAFKLDIAGCRFRAAPLDNMEPTKTAKIITIVGARPNFMKAAPIIAAIRKSQRTPGHVAGSRGRCGFSFHAAETRNGSLPCLARSMGWQKR